MANLLRRFPLQVMLGALVIYTLTVSHGVTPDNLVLTGKVAGWDWRPISDRPLFWLFTLPLRLLPAGWMALGMNLFSMACGVVTLGIMARSLELLPWSRPLMTLGKWRARLPLLLAVAICGLEFNFWRAATIATGEMLDLLFLAAAIWCLLEYHAGKNLRWLKASAIVWGAGMTENWAMLLTLPIFVAALVWLLKFRFFNLRFILSMAALGLAGFSIYALLPMANGLLPGSPWNLQHSWTDSLDETRNMVVSIYRGFWLSHRMITLAIMLFFLMPLLAFLLRFGDDDTKNKSPLDQAMIRFFRGVRAGLLLLGVWLAFDTIFGPRQVVSRQMHFFLPLLTFDYLNALGVAFLAGNLLLIPRHENSGRRRTLARQLTEWLESAAAPLLTVLLAVAVLGLSARNLQAIVLVNRQPLIQFGQLALHSLPPGGGIVLSDFPELLEVFQAAQAQTRDKQAWLPVDVESLPIPEYRERLQRLHASSWLMSTNRQNLVPAEVLQLVDRLAQTDRIYYLHPSFGYFFERFYKQPTGSVFELKRFLTNSINPPPLTPGNITQSEKILDEFTPQLELLQQAAAAPESPLVKAIEKIFRLEAVAPNQLGLQKEWFSMALDSWGVDLQRSGQLPAAERRFSQALSLNTNNWVARINLFCNTNLQAGNKMDVTSAAGFASQIGSVEKMVLLIGHLGPLDDPGFCYLLGNVFQQSGLPRQAMQQFDRARELAPGVLAPQFELARLAARFGMPDRAMELIDQMRNILKTRPSDADMDTQLALIEAGVWLSQTNLNRAGEALQTVVQQHPDNARTLNRISQAYFAIGHFTNAEMLVTQVLHREPDDISALMMQSQIFLQTSRAELAIPVLNRVLSITNTPDAKLTRAMAYVQTGNLSAAKADCLELDSSLTNCFLAEYWLAHIAGLEHDTNQSIHYLQLCLTNAPRQTPIWHEARARLQALKNDSIGK